MSNTSVSDQVVAIAEAWLSACQMRDVYSDAPDYRAWLYVYDARHSGVLELIRSTDLTQGGACFALSVLLDLPPVQTPEDFHTLLLLSEWLNGITLITKDFGADGALMLQKKGDLASLTEQTLMETFRSLCEAKNFF